MIKVSHRKMKKSGGPGVFMHRLMGYMQDNDMIRVVESNNKPDLYLTTVWMGDPPPKCRVIYRAASVYYDAHEKKRSGKLNRKIRNCVRQCDFVVYQSNFARKLISRILCEKCTKFCPYESIIYNGVDESDFVDIKPVQRTCENMFIACGDWTRKLKRGDSIVKAFCNANIADSQLIMIGRVEDEMIRRYRKVRNVIFAGKKTQEDVVSYLKAKPIFVHLCYAESCPNAVSEALSFGCPVVCNNIGATKELVQDDGIISQCDKKFKFKRHAVDLNIYKFDKIIESLRESTKRNWNVNRPDLSMKVCADKYMKAFKETVGRRRWYLG